MYFYLNAVLEEVKQEAEEDLQLEGIREAASKDNEYQELLYVNKNGFLCINQTYLTQFAIIGVYVIDYQLIMAIY